MKAFATAGDLATFIQQPNVAFDPSAQLALDLTSAAIRSYTGQQLDQVLGDVIMVDGSTDRSAIAFLPELPVTNVSLVQLWDGTVWQTVTTDVYSWTRAGVLHLLNTPPIATYVQGTTWPNTPRSVRVTYDHGYAPVPDDIRGVCLSAATRQYTNPEGVVSESMGNYQVRYETSRSSGVGFSPVEQEILGRYRLVTSA